MHRFYKMIMVVLCMSVVFLCGCGNKSKTTITVFAAKSLQGVMQDICKQYTELHPEISFQLNFEGSGTLRTQILQGAECDIFFPASVKEMEEVQAGLNTTNNRVSQPIFLLRNRVCLVTATNSGTEVTGIEDLYKANSMALAAESVPVGYYTRKALQNANITKLPEQINLCSSVGAVASSVALGADEIGTVYTSDLYAYGDKLTVLQLLPEELTGEVLYPVAMLERGEETNEQAAAALDFLQYLQFEETAKTFEMYQFTINEQR